MSSKRYFVVIAYISPTRSRRATAPVFLTSSIISAARDKNNLPGYMNVSGRSPRYNTNIIYREV